MLLLTLLLPAAALADNPADREEWKLAPDFPALAITTIAVLPMDNHSLEPDREKALHIAIYKRLVNKGYQKISADRIAEVMRTLGIQTPGQLSGIAPNRLGGMLNADALLMGQIDQSASIHTGIYDAVVVSC